MGLISKLLEDKDTSKVFYHKLLGSGGPKIISDHPGATHPGPCPTQLETHNPLLFRAGITLRCFRPRTNDCSNRRALNCVQEINKSSLFHRDGKRPWQQMLCQQYSRRADFKGPCLSLGTSTRHHTATHLWCRAFVLPFGMTKAWRSAGGCCATYAARS